MSWDTGLWNRFTATFSVSQMQGFTWQEFTWKRWSLLAIRHQEKIEIKHDFVVLNFSCL